MVLPPFLVWVVGRPKKQNAPRKRVGLRGAFELVAELSPRVERRAQPVFAGEDDDDEEEDEIMCFEATAGAGRT
jgi:hypothetical protein